jgi:hypothetical protein
MSALKTFRIKRILSKKMKQNRPIPQWIRLDALPNERFVLVLEYFLLAIKVSFCKRLFGTAEYATLFAYLLLLLGSEHFLRTHTVYEDCTVPLFIVSDRSRLRYYGNVIWKSLFNNAEF